MRNAVMIKDAAEILNIGSHTLFRTLKDKGIIGALNKLPRRDLVMQGLFEVDIREFQKGRSGVKKQYSVTLVTPAGLSYLREVIEQVKTDEASNESTK